MNDGSGHASFATPRWTLVLAAGNPAAPAGSPTPTSTDERAQALAALCRTYWPPLYAHARRRQLSPADAEDAVQGFFSRLLRLESLADVDRKRGRFRAFLLGSFNHYLADQRDRDRAEKRGAHLLVALDTPAAERAFANAPVSDLPPDAAFDRAWAITLLGRVTARLRDEHVSAGREEFFDALSPYLAGRSQDASHAAIMDQLGLSGPAVRVAIHRLRQRYRHILREEISRTVACNSDVEDELRLLIAATSR
jgi:DNA-directed RNA polymerase specialized sigma24 family protein